MGAMFDARCLSRWWNDKTPSCVWRCLVLLVALPSSLYGVFAVTCTDRLRSLNLLAFPIPPACRNAAIRRRFDAPACCQICGARFAFEFCCFFIHVIFFFIFLFVFLLCSLTFYDFLILCWWASLLAYLIKVFWVFHFIICFAFVLFSWVPYWNLLSCRLIITISCVICYKFEEFWHCTSRFLAALAQLVGLLQKKGKISKSKTGYGSYKCVEYVTDSSFDELPFQFSNKLHSYLRFISPFSARTFTHRTLPRHLFW